MSSLTIILMPPNPSSVWFTLSLNTWAQINFHWPMYPASFVRRNGNVTLHGYSSTHYHLRVGDLHAGISGKVHPQLLFSVQFSVFASMHINRWPTHHSFWQLAESHHSWSLSLASMAPPVLTKTQHSDISWLHLGIISNLSLPSTYPCL